MPNRFSVKCSSVGPMLLGLVLVFGLPRLPPERAMNVARLIGAMVFGFGFAQMLLRKSPPQ